MSVSTYRQIRKEQAERERREKEAREQAAKKPHEFQSDPDRVHSCDECGRPKEEHPGTKPSDIDALLNQALAAQPKTGTKCYCCNTPVLRDLIARYFERKDAGEDMPTINFLCQSIITPRFKVGRSGVEGHIRRCLKR